MTFDTHHLSVFFAAFLVAVIGANTIVVQATTTTCLAGVNASFALTFNGSQSQIMPGFYAPSLDLTNSSTFAVACVPTMACAAQRALSSGCDDHQSAFEPRECRRGYYCPTYSQELPCPEGSWCPAASSAPTKCPGLNACTEKSKTPFELTGLVVLGTLLLLVISAIVWYTKCRTFSAQTGVAADFTRHGERARKRILHRGSKKALIETMQQSSSSSSSPDEEKTASASGVTIEFENISVSVKTETGEEKTILKDVSGTLQSGRVTAVIGPTGAGKTTQHNRFLFNPLFFSLLF